MVFIHYTLPWDGSYLGTATVVATWPWHKSFCYYLKIEAGGFYCVPATGDQKFCAIVEAVRAVLGVAQRGSHRVCIGGTDCLFYRLPLDKTIAVNLAKLPLDPAELALPMSRLCDIPNQLTPETKSAIRRAIALADICMLSQIFDSNLVVAGSEAYTLRDNCILSRRNFVETHVGSHIGKQTFERWFGEAADVGTVLAEALGYTVSENDDFTTLSLVLARCRAEIEAAIVRIEPQWIWYAGVIVTRLSSRLSGL